MEMQQRPLLHRLVPHGRTVRPGMLNFTQALATLGITSIADVLDLNRSEFIRRLAPLCDDDGGQA